MNINDLEKFIEELFENPEKMGDISTVMKKVMDFYSELSEKLVKATPEERVIMSQALVKMAEKFEGKLDGMASQMGISKNQLKQLMENKESYTPEVWSGVQSFQEKIEKEKNLLVKRLTSEEEIKEESKIVTDPPRRAWISS